VGTSVLKGVVAVIVAVDEEKPVWKPLFLKANRPVRFGNLWNPAEIHHDLVVANGPASGVCGRLCGAYSKEALDESSSKSPGLHDVPTSLTSIRNDGKEQMQQTGLLHETGNSSRQNPGSGGTVRHISCQL
jgi:hypothetical protein